MRGDWPARTGHTAQLSLAKRVFDPRKVNNRCFLQSVESPMAQDFFAGCIGGIAGIVVGHPFDTVKVRLQTQTNGRYTGVINCFAQTIKHESGFGLYKGMASPMAGIAFVNSILFGVQKNVMKVLEPGLKGEVIAGSIAGAVQSIIICPVELAKLRVQIEGQGEKHQKFFSLKGAKARQQDRYHGSIECLHNIYKKHGLVGCYRGIGITVLREIPSFAIYFGMFEACCQLFSPDGGHVDSLGATSLLIAGGLSGTASWVFTYPVDVIKSRYQADSKGMYSGIIDCTRKSYQAGGLRSFSQGLTATIVRAFPMNAATFASVVMTLRLVKKIEQQMEYV